MKRSVGCPDSRDKGFEYVPEFDADAVAQKLAAQTDDVLRSVEVLEDSRGPSDETLRTLICI